MGIILSLDPATETGWARFIDGVYHSSGEGTYSRGGRDLIVERTIELAEDHRAQVAVVMETWSLHGKWSNAAKMAVCEAAGRWKDSLAEFHLEHRVVRVQVDEWRRAVLGRSYARAKSEQWKKLAQFRARAIAQKLAIDHNEAEAICIGFWGLQARKVRVLLGEQEAS